MPAFALKADIARYFAETFQYVDLDPTGDWSRDVSELVRSTPETSDFILVTEPEFDLSVVMYPKGEWCDKFMLGVSGGDCAVHAVEAIVKRFSLRAYDRRREEFFDCLADPTCRLREERAAKEAYMVNLYENA